MLGGGYSSFKVIAQLKEVSLPRVGGNGGWAIVLLTHVL